MLQYVGRQRERSSRTQYGNISTASIGAIQRGLLHARAAGRRQVLRRAGAQPRRPDADRCERPRRDQHPRRRQADELAQASTRPSCCGCCPSCSSSCPRWATWTSPSWCSSSTRRTCCSTMRPKALLDKIEQVVRLIRSKGVGVYFVTQNPLDVPDTVLGQLGNRVQHALRAFTPRDQKAVKAAADTFRANPEARRREGHHRARRRRGAGVVARREGPAVHRRARLRRAAALAHRPAHAGGARGKVDRVARSSPATTRRPSTANRPTRSSPARAAERAQGEQVERGAARNRPAEAGRSPRPAGTARRHGAEGQDPGDASRGRGKERCPCDGQ